MGSKHECQLKIGDKIFAETHCVIASDGSKFLLFKGKSGRKTIEIRVPEGSWDVAGPNLLELKGGPARAAQILEQLAAV